MGRIFTISDTHFGNTNVIRYCDRPFEDEAHQTEELVRRWNSVVEPGDRVIHCGDFIMGLADNVKTIVPRLNGDITLVRGNHDTDRKMQEYADLGIPVTTLHYEQYKGRFFIFCHFPLAIPELAQALVRTNKEVVYVHGHTHQNCPTDLEMRRVNVCVEQINYTPMALDDIWKLFPFERR